MKATLIGLLAWLGTAAAAFAADAEGPVVQLNKDGLSIIRDATGELATYKFSDGLKKGAYSKRRLLNYPHLPKQVGMGDTIWIVYTKENQEVVITHIGIKKKANRGPIPPRPAEWDDVLPPEYKEWLRKHSKLPKKPARNEAEPPKKATKKP